MKTENFKLSVAEDRDIVCEERTAEREGAVSKRNHDREEILIQLTYTRTHSGWRSSSILRRPPAKGTLARPLS